MADKKNENENKDLRAKLLMEEMLYSDDEANKTFAHNLWMTYSSCIKGGFTKSQAMDILKTILMASFGSKD